MIGSQGESLWSDIKQTASSSTKVAIFANEAPVLCLMCHSRSSSYNAPSLPVINISCGHFLVSYGQSANILTTTTGCVCHFCRFFKTITTNSNQFYLDLLKTLFLTTFLQIFMNIQNNILCRTEFWKHDLRLQRVVVPWSMRWWAPNGAAGFAVREADHWLLKGWWG